MSEPVGRFTPSRLSPVPIDPQPCDLPYGLTWDDLAPCLPGFGDLPSASSWKAYAKQGLSKAARSCIVTLRFRAVHGSTQTRTLFFKEISDSAMAEAEKFGFLETRDVPTARLLRVVRRGGSEVLVFEFLPTIGIEPEEADEMLALIARLNAVRDPPVELFRPNPGTPGAVFRARVESALITSAANPAAPVRVEPSTWMVAYRRASEAVSKMPVSLNHGEFYFQQVGWSVSNETPTLVMFDLETTALLPRFTDVANILGALSNQTGRDEPELFDTYLRSLRARDRTALDGHQAWRDMRMVRVLGCFQSLPWLLEMANDPAVGDTTENLSTLDDDMRFLGLLNSQRA